MTFEQWLRLLGDDIHAAPVCPKCGAPGSFLRGYRRGHELRAGFDCGSRGVGAVARNLELADLAETTLTDVLLSDLYGRLMVECPEAELALPIGGIGPRSRIQRGLAE